MKNKTPYFMNNEEKLKYLKVICNKSSPYGYYIIRLSSKEYKDIFGAQQ